MAEPQNIQQLGNFKLIKKLGEGGMGAVYLAEDLSLHRNVALKVLPKKFSSDKELASRFRREAKAAGQLNHVNIVGAFAVGEESGYLFYVMEFCEGEPLDKRIKREKVVPVKDALDIAKQVATGLQYAHQHNFVHRDIKPANIVLTNDGVAKILDLGLSKNMADSAQSYNTISGTALGTPHYISPEQARGAQDLDGRADIYSLGCTLYHLVVGQTPFEGATAAVIMMKHLSDPMPSPIDKRADLPLGVVHIITKCTCKAPDDRYKDCAELLQDLERVAGGQMPISKLPSKQQTGKAAKITGTRLNNTSTRVPAVKKEGVPLAALAIIAVAVLVAGVILIGRGGGEAETDKAAAPQTTAKPATNQPAQARPAPNNAAKAPAPAISRTAGTREDQAALEFNAVLKNDSLSPAERQQQLDILFSRYSGTVAATAARAAIPANPARSNDAPATTAAALNPSANAQARTANQYLPGSINLLPLVQPDKDTVEGRWQFENGILKSSNESNYCKLQLPYRAPEEYDLRVAFVRQNGSADATLMLTANGRQFCWCLGAANNKFFGFDRVDGKMVGENSTSVASDNCLTTGQQHVALVQVRRNQINAYFDGRPIHQLQTDFSNFSMRTQWSLSDGTLLGLGSFQSSVAFLQAEIVEITGRGVFTRPNDPAAAQAANRLANMSSLPSHPARWQHAIELLPLVDLKKDTIDGEWENAGGALGNVTIGNIPVVPRLAIPYSPPEEYDLKIEFTRSQGNDCCTVLFTVHGKLFMYVIGFQDKTYGLDFLNGARFFANPSARQIPNLLTNGRRHTAYIQVRKDRIVTMQDTVRVVDYPGQLNPGPDQLETVKIVPVSYWRMPESTRLGLGAYTSRYQFHSVQLLPVNGAGAGEPQRPNDPAAKDLLTGSRTAALTPPTPARTESTPAARPSTGVELLPLIDVAKDAVSGAWAMQNGTLVLRQRSSATRITVPFKPTEEYDLRMTFSRDSGSDAVCLIASCQNRQFMWVMGWLNRYQALDTIDNMRGTENANPTRTTRDNLIVNGRRHTTVLSVRRNRITVSFDGTQMVDYPVTEASKLGMAPQWEMPPGTRLGVATAEAITVHSLQFAAVSGRGEPTRPNDRAARELVQPTPELDAKMFYEQTFTDLLPLLAKHDFKGVAKKLETASNKPEAAAVKAMLDVDAEMATWPDLMAKALKDAAAELVNGAPFTIRRGKTGKDIINVAKDKPDRVLSVGPDYIEVHRDLGGGAEAKPKYKFDTLAPETRDELIKRGLPASIESDIKLLYYPTLDILNNTGSRPEAEVRAALSAAAKDATHGHKAQHLLDRLDAADRETAAAKAFPALEATLKAADVQESVNKLAEYKQHFTGTLFLAKREAALDKQVADLTSPGLWAMFYTLDGKTPFYSCMIQKFDSIKFNETPELARIAAKPFKMRLRGSWPMQVATSMRLFMRGNGTFHASFNSMENNNNQLWEERFANYLVARDGSTYSGSRQEADEAKTSGAWRGAAGTSHRAGDYDFTMEFTVERPNPLLEIMWHNVNQAPIRSLPLDLFKHDVAKRKEYEKEEFRR